MSGKSTSKILKKLEDIGENEDFTIDNLVDSIESYNIKDLYFLRDCINFLIIYKRNK